MDAFSRDLGQTQGRVATGEGGATFVLGARDPGAKARLRAGDYAEIVQAPMGAAWQLVRLRGALRCPVEGNWSLRMQVGGEPGAYLPTYPGRVRRLDDLAVVLEPGAAPFAIRLALEFLGAPSAAGESELAGAVLEGLTVTDVPTAPFVANRSPLPGETDVPTSVRATFNILAATPMDVRGLRVWLNDALVYERGMFVPSAPLDRTKSVVEPVRNGLRIALLGESPWQSGATVRVRVAVANADPALTLDETHTFTVEDRRAPALLGAAILGPRALRLAFDRPITGTDSTRIALVPLERPAITGNIAQVTAGETWLDVTLGSVLSPGRAYEARVWGIATVRGDPVPAEAPATTRFTAWTPPKPAGRRFDLLQMLPKWNIASDASGDLTRLVACFQEIVDLLFAEVDRLSDLFDLERAPEPMLDAMLADLGNPFQIPLTVLDKRKLVANLVDLYRLRGTTPGLKAAARFFLGLEGVEVVPLAVAALSLGESVLGEDWELGASSRFARFAFEVTVPRVLTDRERTWLREIVRVVKPAHMRCSKIREPETPMVFDDWELGNSPLGDSTMLH